MNIAPGQLWRLSTHSYSFSSSSQYTFGSVYLVLEIDKTDDPKKNRWRCIDVMRMTKTSWFFDVASHWTRVV